jgi:hypothetical protein
MQQPPRSRHQQRTPPINNATFRNIIKFNIPKFLPASFGRVLSELPVYICSPHATQVDDHAVMHKWHFVLSPIQAIQARIQLRLAVIPTAWLAAIFLFFKCHCASTTKRQQFFLHLHPLTVSQIEHEVNAHHLVEVCDR